VGVKIALAQRARDDAALLPTLHVLFNELKIIANLAYVYKLQYLSAQGLPWVRLID
jgi:hypothetical protein